MAYIFHEKELSSLVSVSPGRERTFFVNPELAGHNDMLAGVMTYTPNTASPYHLHEDCEHFYLIIRGTATLVTESNDEEMRPGELAFIPAEVPHRLIAKEDLFYFEFQAPNRFKTQILEGTDDGLLWEHRDGKVWVQG